ncbi:MAG: hypothetical protein ACFFDK_18120, partial [Promethearchaeota archaeon]
MKNNGEYSNSNEPLEEMCCKNPNINIRDGNKVCLNCGLIYDIHLVESERRAYSKEEIEKRKQTEPRWRDFGSRTVLPK